MGQIIVKESYEVIETDGKGAVIEKARGGGTDGEKDRGEGE